MSVAKQGPAEDQTAESADLTGARDVLGTSAIGKLTG
jgi:hypothetical protein